MRQLVAILFTDMVGYSRQMDEDESAALRRLDVHNRLLREAIARHDGTEIKTVGDAFVVTFQSAVSAVECALDAQRGFELHNSMVADAERIQVRMGIHAGDVVLRDGDLFGEAVNVAARLEPNAPPGAICISRTVLEQVRRKVRAHITPLGDVALKNISEPMALYVLRSGNDLIGEVSGSREIVRPEAPRSFRRRAVVAGAAGAAALAVAGSVRFTMRRSGAAPRRGGVLRIATAKADAPFDPYTSADTRSRDLLRMVCEPLSAPELPEPEAARPSGVVDTLRVLEGGRRIEIVLRPGVWFHDHPCFAGGVGRKADAADMAFSIVVALRRDQISLPIRDRASAQVPGGMPSGLTIVSPDTLAIELEAPSSFYELSLAGVTMLPREIETAEPDLRRLRQPVGTGPFRFTAPPRLGRVVLERAPSYWARGEDGRPLPYLDRVEVLGGEDYRSMFSLLQKGEIEIAVPAASDQAHFLASGGARPRLVDEFADLGAILGVSTSRMGYRLYGLQLMGRPGALDDLRVRRAAALSLDRAAIVKGSEFGEPSGRFLRDDLHGYEPTVPEFRYDPVEARRLLAAAGHPEGRGLPELVLANFGHPPADEAVATALRAAGFQVRLTPITGATFETVRREKTADAVLSLYSTGVSANEIPSMAVMFKGWGYSGERLDRLAADLDATPARADRVAIYARIESEFLADPPFIPVAWGRRDDVIWSLIARSDVKGMVDPVTASTEGYEGLARAWLSNS